MLKLKLKLGKLWGWLTLVLASLLLLSLAKNIKKMRSIQLEVEIERQKVEKTEKENAELVKKISLNQGPEFIEKQVRGKLGLVKEGERVVVLPDEDTLRKLAPQTIQEDDVLPDPNWKKWLELFM